MLMLISHEVILRSQPLMKYQAYGLPLKITTVSGTVKPKFSRKRLFLRWPQRHSSS